MSHREGRGQHPNPEKDREHAIQVPRDPAKLRAEALATFNDAYNEGKPPTAEELQYLTYLTDGTENIDATVAELDAADQRTAATELAKNLNKKPEEPADDPEDPEDEPTDNRRIQLVIATPCMRSRTTAHSWASGNRWERSTTVLTTRWRSRSTQR